MKIDGPIPPMEPTESILTAIFERFDFWCANTNDVIEKLNQYKARALAQKESLLKPDEVLRYIVHFQKYFETCLAEFRSITESSERTINELSFQRLELVLQSSRQEEGICVRFKQDVVNQQGQSEKALAFLGLIYCEVRSQIIDYRELATVLLQLSGSFKFTSVDEYSNFRGTNQKMDLASPRLSLDMVWQWFPNLFKKRNS